MLKRDISLTTKFLFPYFAYIRRGDNFGDIFSGVRYCQTWEHFIGDTAFLVTINIPCGAILLTDRGSEEKEPG